MNTEIPLGASVGKNYERAPWVYLLWVVPFALVGAARHRVHGGGLRSPSDWVGFRPWDKVESVSASCNDG